MATFVTLITYTDKGIQNIRESPNRADAFVEAAGKLGVEVKELLWTSGAFDGLLIVEAPDETTATTAMLALADAGNVRTHTLRAYTRSEMNDIVARLG